MSLLARGRGLRRMATEGFSKAADLEAREQMTADQISAARDAQRNQLIGMGGGLGAMYAVKQAGTAAAVGGAAAGGGAGVAPLATLTSTSPGGGVSVLKGLETASGLAANTLGTTTATVGTGAAGAGAGAGVAGAVAGAAGGASSALGAVASFAAPIAIGLGAAFLIAELFD